MTHFLFGAALPFLLICGWRLYQLVRFSAADEQNVALTLLLLLWLPVSTIGASAVLFQVVAPRRVLNRRARVGLPAIWIGGIVGILAVALTGVGIAFLVARVPEAVILAAACIAGTWAVLLFCRRVRPGTCVHCGYDVRGSLGFGRCPECGDAITPDGS